MISWQYWKAKLERAYSFRVQSGKITVCALLHFFTLQNIVRNMKVRTIERLEKISQMSVFTRSMMRVENIENRTSEMLFL